MDEKESILIVDDDESTRKSLSLIFSRKGYEVVTAGAGHEAMREAKDRFFNVAILDLKLPDIEGVELLKLLKKIHPDMILIMVTGHASLDTAIKALNEGVSAYITKPLNMDDVLSKVRDAIEKQHLLQENKGLYLKAQEELAERKRADDEIRELNEALERRIEERTAALTAAVVRLKEEVAERELAQSTLEESEAKWRSITENSPDQIVTLDRDANIRFINRTLPGFTSEEVIGTSAYDYVSEGFWPIMKESYQRVLETGNPDRYEVEYQDIDGRILRFEARVGPVKQAEEVVALTVSARDVTEQKKAEEQIRKSQSMLQSVFDGISDPLILLDKNLSVKLFNKATSAYYQVEESNILDKPCYQAFRGRSSPCEGCNVPSAMTNGHHVSFVRKGVMNPGREEQLVIYPIKENGEIETAIIRMNDITENRSMERQLMQNEKLVSLGFLISGVAHEINNPNNFITFNMPILRDYLQTLMPIIDDYATEHADYTLFGMTYEEFRKDLFELLGNIEHGSKRINSIVSNLGQFSRKKDNVEYDWVDIKQIVKRSIELCQGKIKRMVKSLEVDIPEDLPLIYIDPEAIELTIINLLINAAQAADKTDSWIKLKVSLGDSWKEHMIIAVSDNGCGMNDDIMKNIFDPFFTTKPPGEGTGLGLSLCYNLMETMGGRIGVESNQGIGSTFSVILTGGDRRDLERLGAI